MSYLQAVLGLIIFILIAYILSENKRKINWKLVASALGLQFFIGFSLSHLEIVQKVLLYFNKAILLLDQATKHGSGFVFGYLGGAELPFKLLENKSSFIIAFQILPIIIVVSALSSLFFHWGILQRIISIFSWGLKKTLRIDGVTGLGVASSVFLGIIESPIFIGPYLKKMSRSSLFTLITAGMATVAGTVMVLYSSILGSIMENATGQIIMASMMSAPAAIMFAQIIIPSSSKNEEFEEMAHTSQYSSSFEAIISGTSQGVSMVIGICGILIVLFTFIELINLSLQSLPYLSDITLQKMIGYLFIPFIWLMGIESVDLIYAGQLMGTKLILNEFIAYTQLAAKPLSSPKTITIMTFAMCGFANFGSLGILIGGLGEIIPSRKKEIIELSTKAIIAGTLATMFTGAIAGILF